LPSQTATATGTTGQGSSAQVKLAAGGALGCYALVSSSRWELAPCGGLELGSQAGTSDSLVPASTSGPWAALRVEGRLTLRVNRYFAVAAGVGVAVPLLRDEFLVGAPTSSAASIFRPSAVTGRALVGPELRF
jgi:hypothetical protein